MEINKVPPAEAPTVRTGTAAMTGQEPLTRQEPLTGQEPAAANIAPTVDHADIRPLDVPAALQILLAEVRAGLDLAVDAAVAADPTNPTNRTGPFDATSSAGVNDPAQAARALVEMFLRSVPDDASDPSTWTSALIRAETAMQSSVERAFGVVSLWRGVPPAAVDAVKETRAFFSSALSDELNNPVWLRPEWMSLGPLFQRFRRRRRNARRRLTDPDHGQACLDDSEEFRR
jgi:hypothetical protein